MTDDTDKFITELARGHSTLFARFQVAMLGLARSQGYEINPNILQQYLKAPEAPTPTPNPEDDRKIIAFATRKPLQR